MTKSFARFRRQEGLADASLREAVDRLEAGLIDAELGGGLYKQRVARPGRGKSAGYRTILAARIGSRYVFIHGFAKKDVANISARQRENLALIASIWLEVSDDEIDRAVAAGELTEVTSDDQA